jgi:hypothetical protein
MFFCVLSFGAAAFAFSCGWFRRKHPLDPQELRVLRRYSDELHREQIHPFD